VNGGVVAGAGIMRHVFENASFDAKKRFPFFRMML
jgi:hypothetical protein